MKQVNSRDLLTMVFKIKGMFLEKGGWKVTFQPPWQPTICASFWLAQSMACYAIFLNVAEGMAYEYTNSCLVDKAAWPT
jgi:hypothetical protein